MDKPIPKLFSEFLCISFVYLIFPNLFECYTCLNEFHGTMEINKRGK